MEIDIFQFRDYRAYLREKFQERSPRGRGEQSQLARILRCQTAYVSQVLGGTSNFSTEQAALINSHLGHSREESHFFILLVQLERAGNAALKDYVEEQIREALKRHSELKSRLQFQRELGFDDQVTYYSSWIYAAIHIALDVPELRARDALSAYLGLPLDKITEALRFLESIQLIKNEKGRYLPGTNQIHLEHRSPMVRQHHTNWRLQAVRSLERMENQDFHYSSVISISQNDVPRVKETLMKTVERIRAMVKRSEEEELCCYNLDLFSLKN